MHSREYMNNKLITCAFVAQLVMPFFCFGDYQLVSSLPANPAYASKPVLWSILICTLDERAKLFDRIYNQLNEQITKLGLENEIEILYCKDNREYSVGFKRNLLIQQAQGEYTCFVDDDDLVHTNYIKMIYDALEQKPDCVSLIGIITFDGHYPTPFIHSIDYDNYFFQNGKYYRPPNHLNVIKRSVALQFKFPEINMGEDTDWAMRIARAKVLKTEAKINEPYYFYLFFYNKATNLL